MSTSGAYTTFVATVTRDAIITDALKLIGKLDPYETPKAVDVRDCSFKLNMIVKQRMGRADGSTGLKLWTQRRGHLFLGAAYRYLVGPTAPGWTENYSTTTLALAVNPGALGITVASGAGMAIGNSIGLQTRGGSIQWTTIANVVGVAVTLAAVTTDYIDLGAQIIFYAVTAQQPLSIASAVLRDSASNDVPMSIIKDVTSYDALPNKTDPTNISDPISIYYEFQLGNSNLFIDCGAAADVTKHLVLTYLEPVQDMNQPLDNPEYPAEYFLALVWLLAEQIAPMYFKVWSPDMQRLRDEAVNIAFHKDAEVVAMHFQPGMDYL